VKEAVAKPSTTRNLENNPGSTPMELSKYPKKINGYLGNVSNP
jgi:hypothetical protein